MKRFATIREAFDWWIKEVYPGLSPETKKGKLVSAWKDYTYNRGISEERMREILVQYGHFEITMSIVYKP